MHIRGPVQHYSVERMRFKEAKAHLSPPEGFSCLCSKAVSLCEANGHTELHGILPCAGAKAKQIHLTSTTALGSRSKEGTGSGLSPSPRPLVLERVVPVEEEDDGRRAAKGGASGSLNNCLNMAADITTR